MSKKIKEIRVRCLHCSHKFRSMIHFGDVESFRSSKMFGNLTSCPKCGKMTACNKENMSYIAEDGSEGFLGADG